MLTYIRHVKTTCPTSEKQKYIHANCEEIFPSAEYLPLHSLTSVAFTLELVKNMQLAHSHKFVINASD